jgi:hypothetical protein
MPLLTGLAGGLPTLRWTREDIRTVRTFVGALLTARTVGDARTMILIWSEGLP